MTAAAVSRWSRRFVAASLGFLLAWLAGLLLSVPTRAAVTLGLYGFVLHVLFGKAYALVPTYFDRSLALPRAPAVHLPLTVLGTVGLVADALGAGPTWVGAAGAVLWAAGVAVFVGTLAWTVRDNLAGRETGTGEAKAARRPVDRVANAAVPVATGYLLAGTYATLAAHVGAPPVGAPPPGGGLPPLVDGYPPRASHLL
ncbi:MAG: hypothetical protein ABEJ42_05665, partial [Halobacteriaceae archaeon]